jgi:hypothetical protein
VIFSGKNDPIPSVRDSEPGYYGSLRSWKFSIEYHLQYFLDLRMIVTRKVRVNLYDSLPIDLTIDAESLAEFKREFV